MRRLLDDYRNIHAKSGYISGVRRALGAVGISVSWTQWFDQKPQGQPNTHKVTAFVGEQLFEDENGPLSAENQEVAVRFINLTKRWSQDIDFRLGVGWKIGVGMGAILNDCGHRRELADASIPPPCALLRVAAVGKTLGFMCLTAEAA